MLVWAGFEEGGFVFGEALGQAGCECAARGAAAEDEEVGGLGHVFFVQNPIR